ncbi:MAG: hypothetical protein M3506_02115 [Chloroflexota bacterium]|nr:hypothetical protein [Chloroflexota bacterium]
MVFRGACRLKAASLPQILDPRQHARILAVLNLHFYALEPLPLAAIGGRDDTIIHHHLAQRLLVIGEAIWLSGRSNSEQRDEFLTANQRLNAIGDDPRCRAEFRKSCKGLCKLAPLAQAVHGIAKRL